MVVNLCLPPFQTTVRCNKLCADGYDVSNLVSSDPSLRRRGLKLEYFMRPPVEVTLSFRWQVEVCGVDVELWPSGMDQTGAIRRLQIHSSSDANSTSDATAAATATQEGFLQVGRCDVRDGVLLCFRNPRFRPRAPFTHHHPPPPKEGAVRSDLWSRGVQSLGSIAQLRLSIVFSSAGASLGFRTLAVWGVPARSCTPEALEEFQTAHQRCCPQPPLATTRAIRPPIHNPSDPPSHNVSLNPDPAAPDDKSDIPDEFLDPLTQELMVLPMVLPSGAVLDLSSLEEYQRNEARWGRSPNDPFTGVPFTADSKALPFPLLKTRIDQMVLRRSWRPGVSGRGEAAAAAAGTDVSPQTSRLVLRQTTMSPPSSLASHHHTPSDSTTNCNQHTVHPHKSTSDSLTIHTQSKCSSSRNGVMNLHTASSLTSSSEDASHHQGQGGEVVTPAGARSQVQRRKRRLEESSVDEDTLKGLEGETSTSAGVGERSFQSCKKVGADQQTNSIGSHEERLTASLDAALSSALQGRPSYTSQKRRQECTPHTGEGQCAGCSASLTRYPTSPVAYTLPCRHLLCRPCLTRKDPQSAGVSQVTCPTCKSTAPASAVTRVHH